MKSPILLGVAFVVLAAAVVGLESAAGEHRGGGLLYSLLFWVAVAQGCIAVGAIGTFAGARWVKPVRKSLLSVYPMLFFFAAMFFFLWLTAMEIYPWSHHEGRWLNKKLFLFRNFGCLAVSAALGWKLANEANREGPHRVHFSVAYLLSFVATQSLVAFDWVMSLENPWYSTLFGGYFFMESVLSGFAAAGIFWFLLSRSTHPEDFAPMKPQMRDTVALLFGFSVFWAYLMFSQVIVIWYSNLPEETGFFLHRLNHSPIREMMYALIGILFVIPFVTLISRKMKETPPVVLFGSLVILFGIGLERVVFLAPRLSLNPAIVAGEFFCFALLFALSVANREKLLPGGAPIEAPAAGH